MPDEEHHRYEQEDPTEEHAFDKLAKGLASHGISRGRMLAMVGTAIVGGFLGTFASPDESEAKKKGKAKAKKKGKCQKGEVPCHGRCCVPGSVCCTPDVGRCLPAGYTCCPTDPLNGYCGPDEKCCDHSCCPNAPGVLCGPEALPCYTAF